MPTIDKNRTLEAESKAKVLAGLIDLFAIVPTTQTSFVIDLREFRVTYKLSRTLTQHFTHWIDDMLTWDDCRVHGTWLLSDIEWPFCQFSRQAAQRLDLTTRSLVPFKLPEQDKGEVA